MKAIGQDLQARQARRVQHLPADRIICAVCGEQTASTPSFKGYAHKYGPTQGHIFIAKEKVD